jgi:hypothetical protein
MNIIKRFVSKIRQKFFEWRVNREILHRISPHIAGQGDFGYPFHSKNEMVELHIFTGLDVQCTLDKIELAAARMPKFQGDAFRYIAYRDLNERIGLYQAYAKQAMMPRCDQSHCAASA